MRRALRDMLPLPVLRRPKTPLTGDPQWEAALCQGLPPLQPASQLAQYVDPRIVPHQANPDVMSFWADLRPRALDYWLRNLPASVPATKPHGENREEKYQEPDTQGILPVVS
jgi:hypothetical protein